MHDLTIQASGLFFKTRGACKSLRTIAGNGSIMRITTFVIGVLVVAAAVVAVGWSDGRSTGMLVLMAGVTLVIGQIMYLALLIGMAWLSTRREDAAKLEMDRLQAKADKKSATEENRPNVVSGQSVGSKR